MNKSYLFMVLLLPVSIVAKKSKYPIPTKKPETTNETKTTKQKEETPQSKTITISNNIEPKMLKYEHWSGTYDPTFHLTINDQELEPGKKIKISPNDTTLEVNYNYSFMNGYKKGTRKVTFEIPKNAKDIALTFSWENEYRVLADNATAVSIEKVKRKRHKK